MDVALSYGRLRSHLELQLTAVHLLVQPVDIDDADVLQTVLCGRHQVGQVLVPDDASGKKKNSGR